VTDPIPRETFERLFGAAGPESRAALLADVLAARGRETDPDGAVVVVTREGSRRRVVPAPDAPRDGADPVSAADLRRMALYAIPPGRADELLCRHLGRPARDDAYDPTFGPPPDGEAGDPTTPAASVAAAAGGTSGDGVGAVTAGDPGGRSGGADPENVDSDARGVTPGEGVSVPGEDGDGSGGSPGGDGGDGTALSPLVAVLALLGVAAIATAAGATLLGPSAPAAGVQTTASPTPTSTPAVTAASPTPAATGTRAANGSAAERYFELRPNCTRPPGLVVYIQIAALGRDGGTDRGIRTAYRFASPNNREITGPFSEFKRIFDTDAFSPMLDHRNATFGPVRTDGGTARQVVALETDNGTAVYEFVLSKRDRSPHEGCWMTDSVRRLD